jgi:hypothetical protein
MARDIFGREVDLGTPLEVARLHGYLVRTVPNGPKFLVLVLEAAGDVEQDLPKIKEAIRKRYKEFSATSFTAIEYLGAEDSAR